MKNIAIIIAGLKGGGAERAVSNITNNLSSEQYSIYLFVFDDSNIAYPYRGKLVCINNKSRKSWILKVLNFIWRYRKIKALKKEYEIDVSISFLEGPNLINLLTKGNDKVILSIRNYVSRSSKLIYGHINKYIIKKYYNSADLIIGVSNYIKNDLLINYGLKESKVKTIYNFFDLEAIDSLKMELIESDYKNIFDGQVVITVGRLNYYKGHWHLIRSFKKALMVNKELKLVILGNGDLEDQLNKLIKDLKLENNVFLLGFQKNPYKFIYNSKVFILPSISEGFPNVLVEAMACGIPVIASDCKTGPREILSPYSDPSVSTDQLELGKYGVLIPVCDGQYYGHKDQLTKEEIVMSEAIINLTKNKKMNMEYAQKGKKRAEDFNKVNIIKDWESAINN